MAEERPQTMEELLSAIEGEWQKLWRAVKRLTPGQMIKADAGGWSPKDNLAHLTQWMKILMYHYMDGRAAHEVLGVPSEITKDWDWDVINRALFERDRERGIEDVTQELQEIYRELTAKLRAVPFDQLLKPRFPDDPQQGPLLNWVLGNTTEHFAEHGATIEKAA